MANQIASNMSNSEKDSLEGMDMEKMIGHVTKNVFKMMGDGGGGGMPDLGSLFSGLSQKIEPVIKEEISFLKTRDICFDLNVDLEDFYTGKKKKLNVKRKRIIEIDGKQKVVEEKKKLIIPIEKGMKDEQQIRFEGEADQIPGYTPGDIVITLIENEHPIFQRDGDNLIIIKNINFYELYDISFDINHLDFRILRISKNDTESLHLNDSLKKISGEGMPIYKDNSKKGDLFIRFNLIIPNTIEPLKLEILKGLFDKTDPISDTYSNTFVLENVSEADLEELSDYSESDSSDSDSDDSLSSVSSESDDSEIPFSRKVIKKR
jgi:DnaJ-class molecular chaperone